MPAQLIALFFAAMMLGAALWALIDILLLPRWRAPTRKDDE